MSRIGATTWRPPVSTQGALRRSKPGRTQSATRQSRLLWRSTDRNEGMAVDHQNRKYRNGVTCGAKNSACTVKAKAGGQRPAARAFREFVHVRQQPARCVQPSSQAGGDLGEAQRARVARDNGSTGTGVAISPGQWQSAARSSAAMRCRLQPAMPRSIAIVARMAAGAKRHPGDDDRQQRQRAADEREEASPEWPCMTRYSPCSPPHSTKLHAAPCHNPPSSMVGHQVDDYAAPRRAGCRPGGYRRSRAESGRG